MSNDDDDDDDDDDVCGCSGDDDDNDDDLNVVCGVTIGRWTERVLTSSNIQYSPFLRASNASL